MKRLIILFLSSALFASPYARIGTDPSVGVGVRESIGHHGADLSLNVSPRRELDAYCAKSLYLFYPKPEDKNRLYFGGGIARNSYHPKVPLQAVPKSALSAEAVIGYEYRQNNQVKMYTQLECSKPQSRSHEIRLSFGFGF